RRCFCGRIRSLSNEWLSNIRSSGPGDSRWSSRLSSVLGSPESVIDMDRRQFLAGAGASLLAAPPPVEGQEPAKVPRIGYLAAAIANNPHFREGFRQGLRDLGYVEGRNIVIEYRSADGQFERLPDLAGELVRLKVDVLVSEGTPPTLAA